MKHLTIAREGVLKLLTNLKPNKASGPDGISARVLKEAASELAGPLCNIFNMSLQYCSVPDDWRHANVTPIFKKGDRSRPENYRPISLTCIASKLMEHIVTSHIMKYIEGNKMLQPQQRGFRAKLSCETQLVELISDISKCEFVRFSRKRTKTEPPSYQLHQEVIPKVDTIKYLGVKVQEDLKWNSHIEHITSKASTTLSFIRRIIPPQSTNLRVKAYKQLGPMGLSCLYFAKVLHTGG